MTLYVVRGKCERCEKETKVEVTELEDGLLLLSHHHGDHAFIGQISYYEKPEKKKPP